jgi:hypothetical protein
MYKLLHNRIFAVTRGGLFFDISSSSLIGTLLYTKIFQCKNLLIKPNFLYLEVFGDLQSSSEFFVSEMLKNIF